MVNQDGSFSVDAAGPNLFWTQRRSLSRASPTISYTTGRLTFAVDANDRRPRTALEGRQTDVCQVLKS